MQAPREALSGNIGGFLFWIIEEVCGIRNRRTSHGLIMKRVS